MKRSAFKVDPTTRDLVLSGGSLVRVYDIDVVIQNCDHAMRQQAGELQYSMTKGVDYFGNLFGGNPNYQLFKFQAITQLEAVSGVISVRSFDYSVADGELEYQAVILTEYGETTVQSQQTITLAQPVGTESFSAPTEPAVILDGILYAGTSPILAGDVYVGV